MVVIELAFQPTPERLSARRAHRRLLQTLHAGGELHAAGPWVDDSGALLIFSGDRVDVERIIATDPYYSAAGVTMVSVREWTPVIGTGGRAK